MYNMNIISNLDLEIAVNNLVKKDKNTHNIRHIDEIILNHKLFFYIKSFCFLFVICNIVVLPFSSLPIAIVSWNDNFSNAFTSFS